MSTPMKSFFKSLKQAANPKGLGLVKCDRALPLTEGASEIVLSNREGQRFRCVMRTSDMQDLAYALHLQIALMLHKEYWASDGDVPARVDAQYLRDGALL